MLDVQCSTFDVLQFLFRSAWTLAASGTACSYFTHKILGVLTARPGFLFFPGAIDCLLAGFIIKTILDMGSLYTVYNNQFLVRCFHTV